MSKKSLARTTQFGTDLAHHFRLAHLGCPGPVPVVAEGRRSNQDQTSGTGSGIAGCIADSTNPSVGKV